MSVTLADVLPQQHHLDPPIWKAIIASYVEDTGEDVAVAEVLLDQTVAYVAACAGNMETPFAMSTIVDPMWEHFMANFDAEYRELCARFGAGYIGHETIADAAAAMLADPDAVSRTVAAMRAGGSTVVEAVWNREYKCIVGNGCFVQG